MTTLIYAGIGSRATPGLVLADITKMAGWLARTGWHLASGGAHGADTARACVPSSSCSPAARKLHARNAAILLSSELDRPVDAVVAWTRDSAVTGGTGMALRIAAAHGIPVLNLGAMSPREVCERLLDIRRSS